MELLESENKHGGNCVHTRAHTYGTLRIHFQLILENQWLENMTKDTVKIEIEIPLWQARIIAKAAQNNETLAETIESVLDNTFRSLFPNLEDQE